MKFISKAENHNRKVVDECFLAIPPLAGEQTADTSFACEAGLEDTTGVSPWSFIKRNKFILFLLAVVFILRIPSLFEPYWYGDEGIYLTIGAAIKKGLLLYRDVYDNKPPLIYLIAAACNGTLFWFKFALTVSVLASTYFFHRLASVLLNKQKMPVVTATVFFAILTNLRLLEGNIANSEIFIFLPTILGFYFVFAAQDNKRSPLKYFLIGLVFSLGLLLKIPAVFDFLTLLALWIFLEKKDKLINLGKREITTTAGYLLPLVLISVFFFFKGAFGVFFQSVFLQMFGYLTSWRTGSHAFSLIAFLQTDLVIKSILVFLLFALLWLRRKSLSVFTKLVFLWAIFSLFAATLSGRPYPHYLLQVVPPAALLFGSFFAKKPKPAGFFIGLAVIVISLMVWRYHFWTYTTLSYWQNFLKFAASRQNKETYFVYFNSRLPMIYKTAEFIDSYSKPEDKIFIWSNETGLYALSRRTPAVPYITEYHIIDLKRFDQTLEQVLNRKTPLIIVDEKTCPSPQLILSLSNEYIKVGKEGDFLIYHRKNL